MANISTVYTASETKTQLEELSAVKPAPNNSTGRRTFIITLVVEGGVEISPVEIYEALDTKFETVSSNLRSRHNVFELVISKTSETPEITHGENPQSAP